MIKLLAQQTLRLHWMLSKIPIVDRVYGRLLTTLRTIRSHLSYLAWRLFKTRPKLNSSSISGPVQVVHYENAASTNPSAVPGRLIVHCTFHLDVGRLIYLSETVRCLRALPFETVDIFIDTNSERTAAYLPSEETQLIRDIYVHKNMTHPFELTWAHRAHMKQVIANYDFFMYVEDDILITPQAIYLWHDRLPKLRPMGYLPGFLRVEKDRHGRLVSSDFVAPDLDPEIVIIEGDHYYQTKYPYQAFWIYDKLTMLKFAVSPSYWSGPPGFDTRERAAYGFTFDDGLRSKSLLPLDATGRLDSRSFVFHMPCNYGTRIIPHAAGLGTVSINELLQFPRLA